MDKSKLNNIIYYSILAVFIAISLGFVKSRRNSIVCKEININIFEQAKNSIITSQEVRKKLDQMEYKILGYPLSSINTKKLEDKIIEFPQVKEVEVYNMMDSSLNIEISTRVPIVRIINSENKSIYLDTEGYPIPYIDRHPVHVLIANGHIHVSFDNRNFKNILSDSVLNITVDEKIENPIKELFIMAKFIHKNDFWKSQIEQVYVSENEEYELIPRVGAHIIKFGKFDHHLIKFRKLKAFYTEGLNHIGWNDYDIINLKYANQIICKKKN